MSRNNKFSKKFFDEFIRLEKLYKLYRYLEFGHYTFRTMSLMPNISPKLFLTKNRITRLVILAARGGKEIKYIKSKLT